MTAASSNAESPSHPSKARGPARAIVTRLFAWLLVPELLLLLAASATVNMGLKRIALAGVAGFFLLLLPASQFLPQGLLPLKGKWLRRMLAGLAILGMAYGGPVAVVSKVCTYNWTINQVQQGIIRFGAYRPNTRLPIWLGSVDLPRWIGGVPITVFVGFGVVIGLIQFKLLWDDLGVELPAGEDQGP